MKKQFLIKILKKVGLIRFLNFELAMHGITYPIIGNLVEDTPKPDLWMFDLLSILIPKKDGCFVDVGANIGQTLIAVKRIKRDVTYIGFEPNPFCVYYLQKLILNNKFINTYIIPAAISSNTGLMDLQLYSLRLTDSSASIIKDFRTGSVVNTVNVVSLSSDFIKIDQKISILKIDVEGAEYLVLSEFLEKIIADRPFILIEVLPVYTPENYDRLNRQASLMKLIKRLNYKICRIIKGVKGDFIGIENVEDFGIHSDLNKCDYLLTPSEEDLIFDYYA
ncbi:MAG: FkbM family methyltransferase [Thermoflavifilum sp.]|uniref:FkbM family methyltransferase n=1 Tax=Thermoflavifilum sp. TaxID=1968839 RepID=UPI0018A3EA48|nr:FkbM family methyltransferase [Thermoflavifilum sp.]QOR76694.1 MAG: FkbM family methyltransferase [Thermoflavifilum sp.]